MGSTALLTAEWVLSAPLLAIVAVGAFLWLRRRYIAQGRPLLLGALRTDVEPRWRLGLIRLRGERFEWFSVGGPRLGPEHTWSRQELDLGAPQPITEEIPGLAEAVCVTTGRPGAELALTPSTYTAILAWHESAPPGLGVNVV